MKNLALSFALLVGLTTSAFAANPGTICTASTAMAVYIQPSRNLVEVKRWGQVVDTFTISNTRKVSIETNPPIWQTSYYLEDGYKIVTEFHSGEQSGSGYATHNGEEEVTYSSCSKAENIPF